MVGGKNLWQLVRRFQKLFKVKPIGRDKLAKFCQEHGLKVGKRKTRKEQTTYSSHNYAVQPYLLPGVEVTGPGQVLVADITYILCSKCACRTHERNTQRGVLIRLWAEQL